MTFDSPDLLLLRPKNTKGSFGIILESPLLVMEYIKARKALQVQQLFKEKATSITLLFLVFQTFGPHFYHKNPINNYIPLFELKFELARRSNST